MWNLSAISECKLILCIIPFNVDLRKVQKLLQGELYVRVYDADLMTMQKLGSEELIPSIRIKWSISFNQVLEQGESEVFQVYFFLLHGSYPTIKITK